MTEEEMEGPNHLEEQGTGNTPKPSWTWWWWWCMQYSCFLYYCSWHPDERKPWRGCLLSWLECIWVLADRKGISQAISPQPSASRFLCRGSVIPWNKFVTKSTKNKQDVCQGCDDNRGTPISCSIINPYPTALPYGNGMVLHFYQQQESSTTKTVHKVINKGLKTYV